jgi:thioesterase domain-containing protein
VGLVDAYPPGYADQAATPDPLLGLAIACGSGIAGALAALPAAAQQELRSTLLPLSPAERLQHLIIWGRKRGLSVADLSPALLEQHLVLIHTHLDLLRAHTFAPIHAPVSLWWAREGLLSKPGRRAWRPYIAGPSHTSIVAGNHFTLLQPPHVQGFADQLRACLQATSGSFNGKECEAPVDEDADESCSVERA